MTFMCSCVAGAHILWFLVALPVGSKCLPGAYCDCSGLIRGCRIHISTSHTLNRNVTPAAVCIQSTPLASSENLGNPEICNFGHFPDSGCYILFQKWILHPRVSQGAKSKPKIDFDRSSTLSFDTSIDHRLSFLTDLRLRRIRLLIFVLRLIFDDRLVDFGKVYVLIFMKFQFD